MRMARLLTFLLLIAACTATASAQSSPARAGSPLQPKATWSGDSARRDKLDLLSDQPALDDGLPQLSNERIPTHETSDMTCYSMRSYRVVRDNPQSDSTRPAGYSTCQPSTRFNVKNAVDLSIPVR
jgi:hypothetical protein